MLALLLYLAQALVSKRALLLPLVSITLLLVAVHSLRQNFVEYASFTPLLVLEFTTALACIVAAWRVVVD